MIFSQARCVRAGPEMSANPHKQAIFVNSVRSRTSPDSLYGHTTSIRRLARSRERSLIANASARNGAIVRASFARPSHSPHSLNFAGTAFSRKLRLPSGGGTIVPVT
jgi:hypothetical protein